MRVALTLPEGLRSEKAKIRDELTKARDYTENEVSAWEIQIISLGRDGQLVHLNMQNSLQRVQAMRALMSRLSEMMHRIANRIVGKAG